MKLKKKLFYVRNYFGKFCGSIPCTEVPRKEKSMLQGSELPKPLARMGRNALRKHANNFSRTSEEMIFDEL